MPASCACLCPPTSTYCELHVPAYTERPTATYCELRLPAYTERPTATYCELRVPAYTERPTATLINRLSCLFVLMSVQLC